MQSANAPDTPDPLIGRTLLGRYEVLRVLGEGGMGRVYLANQRMGTALRKVAIKTLHPELIRDPQVVQRFHRESETVIGLSHPNTIQFYDFGEIEDHTLLIVMEYVEGESLAHLLERGPVPVARIDHILWQICASLHEAHQRGIVHRDLKPENILLTERGGHTDFVKVLDFGIAKRSEAEDAARAKLTAQGMVLGTPPYMSPEQFSGKALDPRSDIYSLAVMTYEMITGHLPFEANSAWEWATKHLTAEPDPLDKYPAGQALGAERKAALTQAMDKDRDQRQPTALAFAEAFSGGGDAQGAWVPGGGRRSQQGGAVASARPQAQSGAIPTRQAAGARLSREEVVAPTMAAAPDSASGAMVAASVARASSPGLETQMVAATVLSRGRRRLWGLGAGLTLAMLALMGWWWSHGQGRDQAAKPRQPKAATTDEVALSPGALKKPPLPKPKIEAKVKTPAETPVGPGGADALPGKDETSAPAPSARPQSTAGRPGQPAASAQRSRASALAAQGQRALQANQIDAALDFANKARRADAKAPAVTALRKAIARKGGNQVGLFILQGRCAQAQALYRKLRRIRAAQSAAAHFGDWCKRP